MNYKKGDLDGIVTFYEPDGTIIEETTYKNGTPVKKKLR